MYDHWVRAALEGLRGFGSDEQATMGAEEPGARDEEDGDEDEDGEDEEEL